MPAAKKATTKKPAAKKTTATKRPTMAERAKSSASKVGSHGGGFLEFVRTQGVVGLAVGLAIGTAAGASVKVIVDNLINPAVALLTQGIDLSSLSFTVKLGNGEAVFGWGAVLSSLITLVATALVIYWAIHLAKLDRLDKKKD